MPTHQKVKKEREMDKKFLKVLGTWKLVKFIFRTVMYLEVGYLKQDLELTNGDMVLISTKNHFLVLNYTNSSIFFSTTTGHALRQGLWLCCQKIKMNVICFFNGCHIYCQLHICDNLSFI